MPISDVAIIGWNGSFPLAGNYRGCCIFWYHCRTESDTNIYHLGVIYELVSLFCFYGACPETERFLSSLSWVWRAFSTPFNPFISTFNSCISLSYLFVIAGAFICELLLDSWILSVESSSISIRVVIIIGVCICVVIWGSLSSHNRRSIFSNILFRPRCLFL